MGRLTTFAGNGQHAVIIRLTKVTGGGLPEGVRCARTGPDGSFRFGLMPAGDYRIAYDAWDGPVALDQVVAVREGQDSTVQLQCAPFRKGRWRVLTHTDGIPVNKLFAIDQDADGYLWVGTADGACRFDGARFEYVSEVHRLERPRVQALAKDPEGGMWIGSSIGVCHQPRGALSGRIYTKADGLPEDRVDALAVDFSGNVWAGTRFGLYRLDRSQPSREWRFQGIGSMDSWSTNQVNHVAVEGGKEPGESVVWAATRGGLCRLRVPASGLVPRSEAWFGEQEGVPRGPVHCVAVSVGGTVWAGLDDGLYLKRPGEMGFRRLGQEDGMLPGRVTCLLPRGDDVCWIGILGGGLSRFNGGGFVHFTPTEISGLPSLAAPTVRAIYEDRGGLLWVATDFSNLWCMDPAVEQYGREDGLSEGIVTSLGFGPEGVMYAGQWSHSGRGGLSERVPLAERTFKPVEGLTLGRGVFSFAWNSRKELIANVHGEGIQRRTAAGAWEVLCPRSEAADIWPSGDGSVWMGSVNQGILRSIGVGVERLRHATYAASYINRLVPGAPGQVWTTDCPYYPGERGGLTCWDTVRGVPERTIEAGIAVGFISMLLEADGTIWAGGLGRIVRIDGRGRRDYDQAHGIPPVFIHQLARGGDGRLWAATWGGLLQFDGECWAPIDSRDGLAGDTLFTLTIDRKGQVWAGGDGGVTCYRRQERTPVVRIDTLQGGPLVAPGSAPAAFLAGRSVETVVNVIDFHSARGKRRFRWKLDLPEGVHPSQWSQPIPEGELQLLPRDPGLHRLWVQAVDRDLNYSKPVSLAFVVATPWHASPWILGAGAGFALCLTAATASLWIRNRQQNALIQLRDHEVRAALESRNRGLEESNRRMAELDQMKSEFVANVSHEFRTPLAAIQGAAENLSDGIAGSVAQGQRRYLNRIQANSRRLGRLIEDLLDLSTLESSRLRLHRTRIYVLDSAHAVAEAVALRSDEQGQTLIVEVPPTLTVFADPDRLVQILSNLTVNAMKFTPAGGRITIRAWGAGDRVEIEVADTGPGIPEPHIRFVFDRFYRVPGIGEKAMGSGLGLAIVKHLVELHGGRVGVRSVVGEGTCFHFDIPAHA